MSAAELRSAAALIRERAKACEGQVPAWYRKDAVGIERLRPADAEHIASMTPEVALAFADLLDDLADVDTVRRPSLVRASALKAARTYLA